MNILEAHNLNKVYANGSKKLHVLKRIELNVERGEILSIAGPSGAGKSTLLHLLGGLDKPTSGEVLLDGINLYDIDEYERTIIRNQRLGFVFQFYHLLPEFTALENVMLPGLIKKVCPVIKLHSSKQECFGRESLTCEENKALSKGVDSKNKKKYLEDKAFFLLESVGLKDRVSHKPSQLSGGEQQRVAIARALMNEPEIVFCDEPTGNLDSKVGGQIIELLWKLNEEKKLTFVIVTHEEKIAKGAVRVLKLYDGQIIN